LGKPIERELSGGQSHSYQITVAAGQYMHVVVDQRGIDVVVTLYAPDGKRLTEVDSPNGAHGPEPVSLIAETNGTYRLEVRSLEENAEPGKYEVKIEALRQATPLDSYRVRAEKNYIDGWNLYAQGTAESLRRAADKLPRALTDWRAVGDQRREAETLSRIGLVYDLLGLKQKALQCFNDALPIIRGLSDRREEASTLTSIGAVLGEKEKALEYLNEALPIERQISDWGGEATTLNNIGGVYDSLGERVKALEYLTRALPLRRQVHDRAGEATTLNNIGAIYNSLGEKQKALEYLEEALPISREVEDRRGEARTLGNIGLLYHSLGEKQKALEHYKRALLIAGEAGDRSLEATMLNNVGGVYGSLGEKQKALDYYSKALPILRQVGDQGVEASTLNNIGQVFNGLGEKRKALEYYNEALPITRQLGDRDLEATVLNNIGRVYDSLGNKQKALEYFQQALPILRRVGNLGVEATTLNNLGALYDSLGERQRALEYYSEALRILRQADDRALEATTLSNIGRAYVYLGEKQKALESFQRALLISRQVGEIGVEATVLNNIGSVNGSAGEKRKALEYFNESLPIRRQVKDQAGEALTLTNMGQVYDALGQKRKALEYYNRALVLTRAAGDRNEEAYALYGMALAQRDLGRAAKARAQIENAIRILESLRIKVPGPELRSSYAASIQQIYASYVDLLMQMNKKDPAGGFDSAALQACERGRARSLLEMLVESHAEIRNGVDPDLLDREGAVRQLIADKDQRHIKLAGKQGNEGEIESLDKEIDSLVGQYQEVEAQIRADSPKYAALTQPQPLTVRQIQERVLDDDTLLLEYSIGEDHSYLWVVSTHSMASYQLPSRAEIGPLASAFSEQASGGQRNRGGSVPVSLQPNYRATALRLSRMLLSPAVASLKQRRLLIVADGALEYVPFAALPDPGSPQSKRSGNDLVPLIAKHEILSAPSASTIDVMRTELAGRKPAVDGVAILADPVFEVDDPRVTKTVTELKEQAVAPRSEPSLHRSFFERVKRDASDLGLLGARAEFGRLPGTRLEAEQIVSLMAGLHYKEAVDFEASKATADGSDLGQYRYIHFATHGMLNTEHPELTGIVLSMVNQKGEPVDGFLAAREVYNLKLPAEMVVLSACQTALGKQIKGEGFVGLTRGFMYAGSPRVIASLWKVDDNATAELMTRLYTGILKEGKRPAEALRAAQLEMWKQKKYQAPYYWAAFELQGEWR
jgi:tetratricopeptide (TPR) repeat protein/CHAT domain-containing protein